MRDSARQGRLRAVVERLPAEERGLVALWGLATALVTLALTAGAAVFAAVSARRVWRHRRAGWARALRMGVSRPGVAALVAAAVVQEVARAWALRELDRRVAAATGGHTPAGDERSRDEPSGD